MSVLGNHSLKNEMRQKLLAMNSEFSDSDMLLDFVVVMVENKKPKEYVESQLLDLTNENEAKEITEWLFNWLSAQRTQPNPSTQPTSARAFQLALQQANYHVGPLDESRADTANLGDKVEATPKIKKVKDLRNLLSRGVSAIDDEEKSMDIDQRPAGPKRKERRIDRKSPYDRKEKAKDSMVAKCSFFPNCNRENCLFFHPSKPYPEESQSFKGKAGVFTHEPIIVACKFAEICNNPSCTFSHPSPASISLAKASKMSQIACKYFPACLNTQCLFLHDPALVISPNVTQINTMNQNSQAICRFDPNCTRYGCYYVHPSIADNQQKDITPVTSVHKTWVNTNSISNRLFISSEKVEKVEKVEMQVDS